LQRLPAVDEDGGKTSKRRWQELAWMGSYELVLAAGWDHRQRR